MTDFSVEVRQPRTFSVLSHTWESKFAFKEGDQVVKIAVLDTGIDMNHGDFKSARVITSYDGRPKSGVARGEPAQINRIKEKQNFCGAKDRYQDLSGHGTQVAGIILRLAPRAELYIARICSGTVIDVPRTDEQQKAHTADDMNPQPENVVKVCTYQDSIWLPKADCGSGYTLGYCPKGQHNQHVSGICKTFP